MPILDPKYDPLLKRLKLPRAEIQSSLRNPFNAQRDFIGGESDLVHKEWAVIQGENWALGSQFQAGNVLARVGAPYGSDLYSGLIEIVKIEDPILQFREFVEEKLVNIGSALLEEVLEVVSDLAEQLVSSLINAVGSIPVVGWILEALYDVINAIVLIVKMVKLQKASDPEAEYNAAGFNPQTDTDMANIYILGLMRTTADWTNIFRPRGVGRTKSYGELFWSAKLKGDLGRRITTRGTRNGWVGYIPGTSVIDQGWEISEYGTRNLGSLLPTARDMAMMCWKQVDGGSNKGRSGSPAMFTVDADGAKRVWQQFLFDFRIWLREGNTGLSKDARRKFVDGKGRDTYGWAKWDTSFDDKKGFDNFGVNKSYPVRELRRLRKRQYALLNRVEVAYVGPNYGVLKGVHSDDIRKRWDANRKRLLQDQARCLVDVKNIPDVSYRLAMESATEADPIRGKLGCIPQHVGTLTAVPARFAPGAAPPPPGGAIRTLRVKTIKARVSREKRKGKGANLALIGIGTALVYLATRK